VQNKAFSTNKTLNFKGRLVDLSTPRIMAILNVTPDSFYDGGRYSDEKKISERCEAVLRQGATFVDVGGYSSRPGASDIDEKEELSRIVPALKIISRDFPELLISVDTFRSQVARAAVEHGASMINDISGGALDVSMEETILELGVPYVLMHMKGTPRTMVKEAVYENVVKEVLEYFHVRVHRMTLSGIKDIIVDPGFGFAKTREHNFEILEQLELFRITGKPIMAGLSRKSMVWKTLGIEPEEALNGTTVLNTIALMKGVDILRVHDVKEAAEVVKLITVLEENKSRS
jgi:dihydropteroate synthase